MPLCLACYTGFFHLCVTAEKNKPRKKRKQFSLDVLISGMDGEGEAGLKKIMDVFPSLKWHGRGYEAADLHTLLNYYREWAFQLYPKLHFNVLMKKVEKMGASKRLKVICKSKPVLESKHHCACANE